MVDLEIDESKIWSPEERQQYIDTLPEMSLFEDHIIEGDVMVEAMKALIEEGETAETLALHWKKKGNEQFIQGKKYNKMYFDHALRYYTDALSYALKAIKNPSEDIDETINIQELTSTIYSNRAAVQLEKKNYRSCRSDCAKALVYWSKNEKAYYRGAKASILISKPEDALRYCDHGLQIFNENKLLYDLEKKAKKLYKDIEHKKKLKEMKLNRQRHLTMTLYHQCQERQFKVGPAFITDERVQHHVGKAKIDPSTNQMIWPCLFLYDQYGTSDFIERISQDDMIVEYLANMFPEEGPYAEWDEKHEYVASNLSIYALANAVPPYETLEEWHIAYSNEIETDQQENEREKRENEYDLKTQWWYEISPLCTFQQLFIQPNYIIPGIPILSIFVRNSLYEKRFLKQIEHRVVQLKQEISK